MDNLTHTLVGMAVAEAAVSVRADAPRRVPASWRRSCYLLSIVAGNLPDLDLLLTPLTGGKLGYLLHHRGHTHTLIAVPMLVAVTMGMLWLWTRWRPRVWGPGDWLGLWAVAAVGGLLHLGLDYLNSYGVHVFWPFDDRWSFGDSVFVLEPWLWLLLAMPLIGAMQSVAARTCLRFVALSSLGLIWLTGLVPVPMAAVATLSSALLWLAATRVSSGRKARLALATGGTFVAVFSLSEQVIRRQIEAEIAQVFPSMRLADVALSPLPSNLLCWQVLAVGTEAESYVVRDGIAALWPARFPASRCPHLHQGRTASFAKVTTAEPRETPTVGWAGEYVMPLAELRTAATDCSVAAFLRFARVPFRSGDLWGDLRFDREVGEGFAELQLSPGSEACPKWVPPWEPPLRSSMAFGVL